MAISPGCGEDLVANTERRLGLPKGSLNALGIKQEGCTNLLIPGVGPMGADLIARGRATTSDVHGPLRIDMSTENCRFDLTLPTKSGSPNTMPTSCVGLSHPSQVVVPPAASQPARTTQPQDNREVLLSSYSDLIKHINGDQRTRSAVLNAIHQGSRNCANNPDEIPSLQTLNAQLDHFSEVISHQQNITPELNLYARLLQLALSKVQVDDALSAPLASTNISEILGKNTTKFINQRKYSCNSEDRGIPNFSDPEVEEIQSARRGETGNPIALEWLRRHPNSQADLRLVRDKEDGKLIVEGYADIRSSNGNTVDVLKVRQNDDGLYTLEHAQVDLASRGLSAEPKILSRHSSQNDAMAALRAQKLEYSNR